MANSIDQNGVPTINSSGTLTDAEKAEIIQSPAIHEVTFASLLRGFMDVASAAFDAVIDPWARKFYALVSPNDQLTTSSTKKITFTPGAGQTGRSLTWGKVDAGTPDSAMADAMALIVEAVIPKMTVESLVSRVVAALPVAMQDKCLIEVNQTAMTVTVYQMLDSGARATAAENVDVGSAEGIEITLAEPVDAGNQASLIFEGGTTS